MKLIYSLFKYYILIFKFIIYIVYPDNYTTKILIIKNKQNKFNLSYK